MRGLWSQFLPAAAMLLGIWLYVAQFPFAAYYVRGEQETAILYFVVEFLSLPVVGLYFSLSCRSYVGAALATVAVGLLGPPAIMAYVGWMWSAYIGGGMMPPVFEVLVAGPATVCQLLLAWACWTLLVRRLRRRSFPFDRAG